MLKSKQATCGSQWDVIYYLAFPVTQEEMHTDVFAREMRLRQETLKNCNLQQISAALGQSLSVVLLSK